MKLTMKDNKQWVAAKHRKLKIISILAAVIIVLSAASISYSLYIINTGRFYPDVALADSTTGAEPMVRLAYGYDSIIKCPTLPYTMVIDGELLTEESTYCVFAYKGYHITISEIPRNAAAVDIVSKTIIPRLYGTAMETDIFKDQTGYLNERYVQTFGATVLLDENRRIYSFTCRVFLGETDILICGMGNTTEMDTLWTAMENIFYSLHELGTAQAGAGNAASDIDGILANAQTDPVGERPMDNDLVKAGEVYDSTSYRSGVRKKENGIVYMPNLETVLTVQADYDRAALVLAYEIDEELDEIILCDPEGHEYEPDYYDYYTTAEYVFFVDNPMQGEWEFIYTAHDEMGYCWPYIEDAKEYKKGSERF